MQRDQGSSPASPVHRLRAQALHDRGARLLEGPRDPAADPVAESFWRLWTAHHDHLFTLCLRWMGGHRADAEDALSRAALQGLAKYRQHASRVANVKAWLTRLVHNVCMDLHRSRNGAASSLLGEQEEKPCFVALVSREPSPEELLLDRELLARIRGRLAELPPHLRETFVLRFWCEASYSEIALELRTTNANIRKRVQLVRDLIRDLLGR